MPNQLFTDSQIASLKKELNFLLWTKDIPAIPLEMSGGVEPGKINIQCTAHTIVTSSLFFRRRFDVITRVGGVFIAEPHQDPKQSSLHQIPKHWWFTLVEHGVVDLSLYGETTNPLIYGNRSVGSEWLVRFGDNERQLRQFLKMNQRGCFYLTVNKKKVSEDDVAQALSQPCAPAKNYGVEIPYARIVAHCEALLEGGAQALAHLSQKDAWRRLNGER